MKLLRAIFNSLLTLGRNPTRTLLTMLGIVIGIAAVITMMEIGNGSKRSIRESIEKMGANSIMIIPGSMRPPGSARQSAGTAVTLTPDDAAAIAAECPNVGLYSQVVQGGGVQIISGNVNWSPGSMYGVAPAYLAIRNWTIARGRCFTEAEVAANARVCVIGSTIVREVFQNNDPINAELRIGEVSFKVVGVLQSKGANMIGMDEDDVVLAPWTTLQMRVTGLKSGSATHTSSTLTGNPGERFAVSGLELYPVENTHITADSRFKIRFMQLNQIIFSAVSSDRIEDAITEVTDLLRRRHGLEVGEENDFRIRNSADFMSMLNQTTGLMTNLLLGVALISLIVGGVGIMNIMLVSVTERTREIGLRMAIGATSMDILKQFLLESMILCVSGGILGILLGHGASKMIEVYLEWPVETSVSAIVSAVSVSMVIGMVFGFYPAWKASKLDPIEALRYE